MTRVSIMIAIVWIGLNPPVGFVSAPPSLVTQCSKVEYRQDHLAECNSQDAPGFGVGGGNQGGGLIGGLLHAVGLF